MFKSWFIWLMLSLSLLCAQCGPVNLNEHAFAILGDGSAAADASEREESVVVPPVPSLIFDRSLPESVLDQDHDGDGVPRRFDCDDTRNFIYPGAVEICDGFDDDCNGIIDDGFGTNEPCDLMDGCGNWGTLQCGYDGWSVTCDNQEAYCP